MRIVKFPVHRSEIIDIDCLLSLNLEKRPCVKAIFQTLAQYTFKGIILNNIISPSSLRIALEILKHDFKGCVVYIDTKTCSEYARFFLPPSVVDVQEICIDDIIDSYAS